VTYTAVPGNYFCDSAGCGDWGGLEQHDPITGTFSKPIYRLIVEMLGRFQCSGQYGSVKVFNRRGTQVEDSSFILEYPDDCGDDNITGFAIDTIQFSGGISQIIINPPQPWSFSVGDQTGFVGVGFDLYFDEVRPPTVDSCLTGDELLDQQETRDMLRAAWDSAFANGPPNNRRELRLWLFEDSTGALVWGAYRDPSRDTPCASFGTPITLLGVPIASSHPHPFAPGDTLPPSCGFSSLRKYDIGKYGGASGPDIMSIQNDSLPMYILDKNSVYMYPVGTTKKNARSKVRVYPRVDPVTGCMVP